MAIEPADLQQLLQPATSVEGGDTACPGLATGDAPPARQLRELYQARSFQPLWDDTRRSALQREIDQLADDGMDPYSLALPDRDTAPACAELLTSQRWLQALDQLANGILPAPAPAIWHAAAPAPRIDVLSIALSVEAAGVPASFARARPATPRYLALRQLYAGLRRQPIPPWPLVDEGPMLRPGQSSPRVPQLASRLAAEGYMQTGQVAGYHENPVFDDSLAEALRHFQQRHSLQEDALLGPDTLRELNLPASFRLAQLRINLERWRWLYRELESDMLLVDIAGQQAMLYRQGQPVWTTRLQVGRAERQTPQLKSRISRLTLNPTWTVPPTILRKDKLPEIRRDIGYLKRHRIRVLDHNGRELNPYSIDWWRPSGILLRQDAGPDNALGQIAFRFDNPFSVYLHDTPSQQLFDKRPRVFSSGCVRVENAMQLRDLLLEGVDSSERDSVLERHASGRTHEYNLPHRLPLLLAYWTVEVDAQGPLFRPDLYLLDTDLIGLLTDYGTASRKPQPPVY